MELDTWTEVQPSEENRLREWEHDKTLVIVYVEKISNGSYRSGIDNPQYSTVDRISIPEDTLPGPFTTQEQATHETNQWARRLENSALGGEINQNTPEDDTDENPTGNNTRSSKNDEEETKNKNRGLGGLFS